MENVENIASGWLKTREGSKFAPHTLIDQVINGDTGETYESSVQTRFDAVNNNLMDIENSISRQDIQIEDLYEKTDPIENIFEDKYYIADKDGNILAIFDENGLEITEIKTSKVSIEKNGNYNDITSLFGNCKTIVGYYKGTKEANSNGSTNPCELNFASYDFYPVAIVISKNNLWNIGEGPVERFSNQAQFWVRGMNKYQTYGSVIDAETAEVVRKPIQGIIEWKENSIKWYANALNTDDQQLNAKGTTYHFIAFGLPLTEKQEPVEFFITGGEE